LAINPEKLAFARPSSSKNFLNRNSPFSRKCDGRRDPDCSKDPDRISTLARRRLVKVLDPYSPATASYLLPNAYLAQPVLAYSKFSIATIDVVHRLLSMEHGNDKHRGIGTIGMPDALLRTERSSNMLVPSYVSIMCMRVRLFLFPAT